MANEYYKNAFQDPNLAGDVERTVGRKNPYDINSSNPEEQDLAMGWYQNNALDIAKGKPQRPDYIGATNPDGTLKDNYKYNPASVSQTLDKSGLNEIQKRALSNDPSAYAQLLYKQQEQNQFNNLDKAAATAEGNAAGAYSQLASRGGLSSGARERVARDAAEGSDTAKQSVYNQGMQDRTNIGLQDQQLKDQMLEQLPGQQLGASNFDLGVKEYNANNENDASKFNVGTLSNNNLAQNTYNANAYNEQMKGFAAGKTADASTGGKK